MFNNGNGYSLADLAAATRGNENDMWGGSCWWIIILFMIWGWGGNGFGFGNREGFAPNGPWATQGDVRAAVDQQTLISKLDQQTYGLADSTYALNNTISSGFHGVDSAICGLGYNIQSGMNELSHQISDASCGIQRGVERGFADTNYNMASQFCETRRAISDNARDIIENNNNGIRSILDFLTNDKIATLTAENQSLKFAASQNAQTAYLAETLAPKMPIPSYSVPNPFCCNNYYGCNG